MQVRVRKQIWKWGVQSILSLMEPSYLEAKTDTAEAMRRLLFAGLIAVADAHDGISAEELEVFSKFFGKYAFSEKLHIEKIKETLEYRAREVKEKASVTQGMQVLHDMCLMAKELMEESMPQKGWCLNQLLSICKYLLLFWIKLWIARKSWINLLLREKNNILIANDYLSSCEKDPILS